MAFDDPMASIEIEHLLRIGGMRGVTGDTINNVIGFFTGFFLDGMAMYDKDLTDKGKVEVVVELGRGPDRA